MNYYIADLHFGHENVIKFDHRPFQDVEEMDQYMIRAWNQRVMPEDDVYILGDLLFKSSHSAAWYLEQLAGKKHLILGNHDGRWLSQEGASDYLESIDDMLCIQDHGKDLVLCHYPLAEWDGFYRGTWHLYGHIHNKETACSRYMDHLERAVNVGCMFHDYQPVTFEELQAWKQQRLDSTLQPSFGIKETYHSEQ